MTGHEIFGWSHRFNGHEPEQALGVGDGQREARPAEVHGFSKSQK